MQGKIDMRSRKDQYYVDLKLYRSYINLSVKNEHLYEIFSCVTLDLGSKKDYCYIANSYGYLYLLLKTLACIKSMLFRSSIVHIGIA